MTATCFAPTPPPFLVIVQVETACDEDDPAGWRIFPARTEEEIQALQALHDGRNFGTEVIGVYRWDPAHEGSTEASLGAYVPHPRWTSPRPW